MQTAASDIARAQQEEAHAEFIRKMSADLASMKLSALQRRALSEGLAESEVQDAVDSGDPQSTLASLILACHPMEYEGVVWPELMEEGVPPVAAASTTGAFPYNP